MDLQVTMTFSNLINRGQEDPPDEGLQKVKKREKEENKITWVYSSFSTEPFPWNSLPPGPAPTTDYIGTFPPFTSPSNKAI